MIEDKSDSKWAIMICLNREEDDWIFVTEDSKGNCWDLRPVLFDDINDALEFAATWALPGKEENVQVVNYEG